ncbi:MAG: hypothetical protein ACRCX2_36525 [Paraclostridium sp.]
MKNITLELTEEQFEKLKTISENTKMEIEEITVRIIDRFLNQKIYE